MRYQYSVLFVFLFSGVVQAAESFGPRESRLLFEEKKGNTFYRIDNSDKKLPWLVQAWVEDASEKKTTALTATPMVFRVEPSSVFTVRVVKTGALPEDRETLFWAVSNSLPGGVSTKQDNEEGKISAKLSLAYRFKVPLIYRPAALDNFRQEPEKLEWTYNGKDGLKLYNPTRYVVQLHNVTANGREFKGKGVSFILLPMSGKNVSAAVNKGTRIKYGVINDYGAVKEYDGVVK
ncbi:TPA: molecular chaperone [Escherichia coli]|uniref:Cro/Cl family transcriptional regulator n=1 Tax=Escherichia coli TaxID=562 RepID=A0A0A0YRC6_ECOLX|nr:MULTISPECIES: molecular chaperone [Escherichia]AIX09813.1 CsnB [Escherichia coli]EES3415488.1 molecular chaperone [Escherichia coli]EFG6525318.1 molecular chaperone [Escherichia coli]EFH8115694.1 fimbria/pilus periplasmic chaperone [Escherichia coli]EFI2912384.1 molecular chaperone [Escherichia coli]